MEHRGKQNHKNGVTVLNRLSVSFKELSVDTFGASRSALQGASRSLGALGCANEKLLRPPPPQRRVTMSQSTQTQTRPTTFTSPRFLQLTDTRRKLDFENISGPSYKYGGIWGGGARSNITPV